MNEITKNDSEKINELFSIISNIKQEIKEFKVKIKNDENSNPKEENRKLKEEIKDLKDESKNMKENNLKEIKMENIFIDIFIINNMEMLLIRINYNMDFIFNNLKRINLKYINNK